MEKLLKIVANLSFTKGKGFTIVGIGIILGGLGVIVYSIVDDKDHFGTGLEIIIAGAGIAGVNKDVIDAIRGKTLLLVLILSLSNCTASKRAQIQIRKAKKHLARAEALDPSIAVTKVDTVYKEVITKEIELKEVVVTKPQDTIYLTKDKLSIKVIRQYDTLKIEGDVQKDTIVVKVPCEDKTFTTKDPENPYLKRLIIAVLGILGILAIIKFIRK